MKNEQRHFTENHHKIGKVKHLGRTSSSRQDQASWKKIKAENFGLNQGKKKTQKRKGILALKSTDWVAEIQRSGRFLAKPRKKNHSGRCEIFNDWVLFTPWLWDEAFFFLGTVECHCYIIL